MSRLSNLRLLAPIAPAIDVALLPDRAARRVIDRSEVKGLAKTIGDALDKARTEGELDQAESHVLALLKGEVSYADGSENALPRELGLVLQGVDLWFSTELYSTNVRNELIDLVVSSAARTRSILREIDSFVFQPRGFAGP